MKGKKDELYTAARAVEITAQPQDDTITLSTGVVLRGRKANPVILVEVMSIPEPPVPTYFNNTMGREMENPDDPEYIQRRNSWKAEQSNRMLNALIILGTELVSTPKGVKGPKDNAWLEEYSLLGIPTHPESETWRYLAWVKYKACADEKDLQAIQEVVGRLSGVRESAVKSAENFSGSDQTPG